MSAAILVDAFVGKGALGNRAAVVISDSFPDKLQMQAAARKIGAPATAFVREMTGDDAHQVRWFGPDREIALCGHGALAAGHVLLRQYNVERLRLVAADGRMIEVRRLEGDARYEMALPAIPTEPRDWPELTAALRARPEELRWNSAGYALAVFSRVQEVLALRPDAPAMADLGNLQVTATTEGGEDSDITSRVFSGGGSEDMATGSAHSMLTPYWCDRLNREKLSAYQASERGGRFECRLEGAKVWLGGQCRTAD